uniref:ACYPI009868 protein n=1 Tax=Acyrthosiphon pisum TaxID=7029 RepID=C4WWM5_ACYPI|nr:ACYPI009868 [Acyrthosiphon pisum]
MNSLVADYGDETDTDSLESDQNLDENTKDMKLVDEYKTENKLPAPRFKDTGIINESVFRNPYLEAERAKCAVLEKHVKMVPAKDHLTKVNGKNICWMNKKGRCRFGNKCKFAHDSELFNGPNIIDEDKSNKESSKSNKKKEKTWTITNFNTGKKNT